MLNLLAQLDPNQDVWVLLQEGAKLLMSAGMSGSVKVAVILMLVIALTRKLLAPKVAFLRSDLGAVLLTIGVGVAAGVANALVAGSALSWGLLGGAFTLSLKAAGGYTMLKKAALPVLLKMADKAPGPLGWVFKAAAMALGAFGIEATKKAEAAGDEAVKNNPPSGVAGVIGGPKDVG